MKSSTPRPSRSTFRFASKHLLAGSRRAPLLACASALVAVAFNSSSKAPAASYFWNGATNNWSDSSDSTQNWLDGFGGNIITAPTSSLDNLLFFGGGTAFTSTHDLGDGFLLNGLTLSNSSGSPDTITGNSLSFVTSTGAVTPFITQSGNSAVTIADAIILTNPLTLNGAGTGVTTFSGAISGGSLLTVSAGNWLATNLTNSWSGGLTLTGGTLEVTNTVTNGSFDLMSAANGLLGNGGTLTINGGTLKLTTNGTGTINGGVTSAATGRVFTFGTNGGTLNINGQLGGSGGANGGINIALPSNVAQLNSPAVIKFNGGAQGFDTATNVAWSVAGNVLRFTNPGTGIANLNKNNPVRIELTNGALFALDNPIPTTIASPFTFAGVIGGDPSATGTEKTAARIELVTNGSYTFTNGLTFDAGAIQVGAAGGQRAILGPITFLPGANVGFSGRGTGSSPIASPEASATQLGSTSTINVNTITISSGATAAMDVRLRTDLATSHGVQVFDKTNILAGGTLKFTQSWANTVTGSADAVGWIDVRGDIVGNGTSPALDSIVDLRLGAATSTGTTFTNVNGVTFNNPGTSGADLIVNGSGFGGLKVTASNGIIRSNLAPAAPTYIYGPTGATDPITPDAKVSNLLSATRLAALTGTGGYLTPAPTGVVWNFPSGGEWSVSQPVGLKVSDSNTSGTDVSLAAVSGTGFTHNVAVEAGATLDTGSSAFTFGPATTTPNLGLVTGSGTISGSGGIVINGGATVAPGLGGLGTLTVGNMTLNGTLQIETAGTSLSPSDELVASTLTLGATSILNLPLSNAYSQNATDYIIASYTSLVGTAFSTIQNLPIGYSVTYGSGSNDFIKLHYAAIPTNIWAGTVVGGIWDIGTTANWQSPTTTYTDGNIVQFDNTATGTLNVVVSGNVSPGAIIVSNDSSHNYTITSTSGNAIVGGAALTKSGNGKLTLSGPNAYGGGTTINGGTIELGSDNALPTAGAVIVNASGTLDLKTFNNTVTDATVSGAVNGSGTLTVNSLTLVNSPTFSPNLALHGALTKNGTGSATLAGSVDLNGSTQTVSVAVGTGPELTLSGVLQNGGISKTGNGTLLLGNAANTFTGGVTVGAGTVRVGTAGALPAANALTVNGSGILDGNNTAVAVSSLSGNSASASVSLGSGSLTVTQTTATAFAGAISGTGASVTKMGSGELDLTGTNSFTAGLNVSGGSVRLGNNSAAGTNASTITVNTNGTVALATGGITFANPVVLAGGTLGNTTGATAVTLSGSVTVNSASVIDAFDPITLANGVNGQDVLLTGTLHGSGNLLISAIPGNPRDANGVRLRGTAAADYSGTITVQAAAKFEIQSANVGTTVSSPAGTATVAMGAGTYTPGVNTGTFPIFNVRNTSGATGGSINLGNNVQINGTGTALINMLGTVTTALNVVDSLGSLTIGNNQSLVVASNNGIVQTLSFTGANLQGGTSSLAAGAGGTAYPTAENITLGPITETSSSSIVANGIGTLTLANGGSYTGSTTVASGTVAVNGSINGSTALIVNAGTLKFGGNNFLNHTATATLTDGAIFNTGGFSETLGALTLTVATTTAKIDLGTGASVLQFADSSASSWTGTLEIDNWSGNPGGGGTDELLFGSTALGLGSGQIAEISFLNPDGFSAGTYSAQILSSGELVPGVLIPEPGSLATVVSGFGMLMGLQRFRRRR